MLARLVQRWSLVDGGSLPGSTKAPITPPSNRMVRPGQRRRWASVAASKGTPTPAKTTCPSFNCRALRIILSSEAEWLVVSVIENAPAPTARRHDFINADQRKEFVPVYRSVDVLIEVLLHAADRVPVDLFHIGFEVVHHRLIDAVAFVRRRTERNLDHGIDAEEGNFGLIRRTPDLIVGYDAFSRQDHPIGGHGEVDIHELQAIDLGVAVGVAALHVDQGDIGVERGNQQQLLAGERALDLLCLRPFLADVRSEHRTHRHKGNAHGAGAKAHSDAHVTPLVITRVPAFDVMAHHLGQAPQDALREPARDNVVGDTRSEQEIAIGRDDAARAGEFLLARPDQLPNQRHRRAGHGGAPNADGSTVADEGRRLFERDHLFAKAAVPPRQILPQLLILLNRVPSHHYDLALPALIAWLDPEASALKSSIKASHRGRLSAMPSQNDCDRRRSKSSTLTPCCSTHV